jgi:hypothetical protein
MMWLCEALLQNKLKDGLQGPLYIPSDGGPLDSVPDGEWNVES